mgnify:CR=1 FL=1|tara:strand:+ start:3154 stop:4230 length:1077 start_codon:yes stop_codon:yes gene_type:complete
MHLDYLEFYISHTCNFNCIGCNRFNNYLFTGHQRWHEHLKAHQQWAEKLTFDRYRILGGEPLLNPDIVDWIRGTKQLWPNTESFISTNASFKRRFDKDLYTALVDTQTVLEIGLHDINRKKEVLELVNNFTSNPVIKRTPLDLWELPNFGANWASSYNRIRDESWPDCNSVEEWNSLSDTIKQECEQVHHFSLDLEADRLQYYNISDDNGLQVVIKLENFFYQPALLKQPERNTFTLHNSDPYKAHEVCASKYCHHMMAGKISKCGPSVLFQEFDRQFEVELSKEDRELMMSYKPLTVDADEETTKNFFDSIRNPIDQCKFCPQTYAPEEINSSINKDKFGKRRVPINTHTKLGEVDG